MTRAKHVLVVEDNDDLRWLTLKQLNRHGYYCAVASSGSEALRMLDSLPQPTALIVERYLPDMEGRELCAKVKAKLACAELPTILFSTAVDQSPSPRADFAALVPKNGTYRDLISELNRLTGGGERLAPIP